MASKSLITKRLLSATSKVRCYSAVGEPYGDSSIPQAKRKYVPTSGTYPKGFLAGTSHAGVKASNTSKDDITMVVSDRPCAAGAVFTRNIFKAAPVQASKQSLQARQHDGFRGIVVNSGCANAVTGKLGLEHAATMAWETDRCFGEVRGATDEPNGYPKTLVMSTGVIGQLLPIDKITAAIPKAHQALGSDHKHWLNAAKAICTTDTFPKLLSSPFRLPSHPETEYRIAGMTKGAGMIHPNMATLLGIICTDVKVEPASLSTILRFATNPSFNSISIDGDTSTNDTVALFANGAAAPDGVKAISLPPKRLVDPQSPEQVVRQPLDPDTDAFANVLKNFMVDLAKLVVRDGEGATKFVTIRVRSDADSAYITAKRAAVSIAKSALVKTALYGKDANWGRILCAIGYAPGIMPALEIPSVSRSNQQVQPEHTSVSFVPADGSEELKLLVRGEPQMVDEVRAKQILEMEDLEILVRLEDRPEAVGSAMGAKRDSREAVVWTCDFSHEYVTINGDYRT